MQTTTTETEGKKDGGVGISRRNILKTTALATGALAFGVPSMSGYARAASNSVVTETIYLVDTGDTLSATRLFTVDLDTTPGEAALTLVETFGSPFQKVDAVAATPDGEKVVLIDRNTRNLGEYDVDTGTFVDRGVISGLPNVTVLAAYGIDGNLYAASNSTNKLYTVDGVGGGVSPPVANEVGTITGATVNGADLVVDSTGTMFLHTNDDDTLYTVDYQNPDGNGNIATSSVGSDTGSSLTGLAVRDSGQGDLVGSSRADDAIVFLDKTDGTRTSQSNMTLDGDPYTYSNGDMATGTVVEEGCVECTTDELLAKYEFACVEEVEGECLAYDFVFEKGDDELVTYEPGSYETKPGESFEPISATFGTDLCGVYAVVKAGNNLEVQELINRDGNVTVEYIEPHAISFVEFYCDEEEAEKAAEDFASQKGCINTRDLGRGQEDQECPQDREIVRGGSRDDLDRSSGRLGRGIQRDSRTEQRGRNRRSRRRRRGRRR
jgi:hypothetical protein